MNRFLPRSITSQIILLVLASLIVSQVLNFYFLIGERRAVARASQYEAVIDRMVDIAKRLPEYEISDLPLVLEEGADVGGVIFLSANNRADISPGTHPVPRFSQRLRDRLTEAGVAPLSTQAATRSMKGRHPPPPGMRPGPAGERGPIGNRPPPPPGPGPILDPSVYHPQALPDATGRPGPGFEEIIFSAELAPGVWLNSMNPHYSVEVLTGRVLLTTALSLLIAAIAAALLARRILQPIRELSVAAEALGRGEAVAAVPETGADDIKAAAHAFNTMQQRLVRQIEEQRVTLRAVGHDLKTPLTSLRIRAEDLPEEHGRAKFIASIDDLTDMTTEILNWSKTTDTPEETASVDLASLIDSIAQDYADRGEDVVFIEPGRPMVARVRRVGLRRAIVNLIDNALKYAGNAKLSIVRDDDYLRIRIDDNGPGIPVGQLSNVFVPFNRLESSRNRSTGGMGLGLSIAQSLVQSHGGTLILSNQPEGGLRATLSLPLPADF